MSTNLSKSDKLTDALRQKPDPDRLHLLRNLSYGGAAVSIAVLAGLTQVGAKESSLQVSVFACAISLPVWLLLGAVFEYYLFLGADSYPHLKSPFMIGLSTGAFAVAGIGMIATTVGIIWFLLPQAAYAFGVAALVAIVTAAIFHLHLARWWFRDGGSGGQGST